MRLLLIAVGDLNKIEKRISAIHNIIIDDKASPEDLQRQSSQAQATIGRLKNETFDDYKHINNKLNGE